MKLIEANIRTYLNFLHNPAFLDYKSSPLLNR